jgi:hypothetical protein
MRYIDTGSRDPSHALATWLQTKLTPSVAEVRWQTGFFNAGPLGLFAPTLQRLAQADGTVHALIGLNEPGIQRDDLMQLVQMLGLPRQYARLGVVQYGNTFFHPKTYHFRRDDGSQCAYVGSANLTGQGVAWHVEAGLTLDTNDGDPEAVLNQIAAAVDAWFAENRAGLHVIASAADIEQLIRDGVLIEVMPQPLAPPAIAAPRGGRRAPPQLSALANLPPLSVPAVPPPEEEEQLILRIRARKAHRQFRAERLQPKINRERQAWDLVRQHRGDYTRAILNTIFDTVDNEPGHTRWFGQMLAQPNRDRIFQSSKKQLSRWIEELLFKSHPYQEALNICLREPRPSGASKGLATLLLYLSDPCKYNVWLPTTEKGLRVLHRISTLTGDGEPSIASSTKLLHNFGTPTDSSQKKWTGCST